MDDYVIANISEESLQKVKALEKELVADSSENIVLIAYKETES